MDKAFPHLFDQYPKPFGCSGCMAFWAGVIASVFYTVTPFVMITMTSVSIPFVSLFAACLGYRVFRLM